MSMAAMAAKWAIQATIVKSSTVERLPLMSEQHSAKSAADASQVLTLSEERNASSALTAAVVIAMRGELVFNEIDSMMDVSFGVIYKNGHPFRCLHPSW